MSEIYSEPSRPFQDGAETCVYIITQAMSDFPCKVGMSENPDKRVASLQCGSPSRLVVRETYWFGSRQEAAAIEREFHQAHVEDGMNGEWFGLTFEQVNYWLFLKTMSDDEWAAAHA